MNIDELINNGIFEYMLMVVGLYKVYKEDNVFVIKYIKR